MWDKYMTGNTSGSDQKTRRPSEASRSVGGPSTLDATNLSRNENRSPATHTQPASGASGFEMADPPPTQQAGVDAPFAHCAAALRGLERLPQLAVCPVPTGTHVSPLGATSGLTAEAEVGR